MYNNVILKSSSKVNRKTNMILIFSHELTAAQVNDAQDGFGVCEFIKMPQMLQDKWSNVPPELSNLDDFIESFKNFIKVKAKTGDIVLVQGDFGATYGIVEFCKKLGVKAVYATTKRIIKEGFVGNQVVKSSVFEHVRFREYW